MAMLFPRKEVMATRKPGFVRRPLEIVAMAPNIPNSRYTRIAIWSFRRYNRPHEKLSHCDGPVHSIADGFVRVRRHS